MYVTAGYGAGCKLIKIGPGSEVTTIYEHSLMKNHHGGVVLVGEHVWPRRSRLACQNFLTGKEVWNFAPSGRRGHQRAACCTVSTSSVELSCLWRHPRKAGRSMGVSYLSRRRNSQHARRYLDASSREQRKLYLRDQDLVYCYNVKG